MNWRYVKFSIEIIKHKANTENIQTPSEVGFDQINKIMSCTPLEGYVESYAQVRKEENQ